jgi:hypothetical protein
MRRRDPLAIGRQGDPFAHLVVAGLGGGKVQHGSLKPPGILFGARAFATARPTDKQHNLAHESSIVQLAWGLGSSPCHLVICLTICYLQSAIQGSSWAGGLAESQAAIWSRSRFARAGLVPAVLTATSSPGSRYTAGR